MKIINYNVLAFEFDYSEQTTERDIYIVDIIYRIIKDKNIYLFEINPSIKDCLLKEFTPNYKIEKKYDKNTYIYSTEPIQLTKEDIASFVGDSLFYLGHFAIVLAELTEETVSRLIASWMDERVLSGIEMIRMDYDGLCVFFYNMRNDKILLEIIDEYKKIKPVFTF